MRHESECVASQMRTSTRCQLREPVAQSFDLTQITSEIGRNAAPPHHFDLVHPGALRDQLIDATVGLSSARNITRPHPNNGKALEGVAVKARVSERANISNTSFTEASAP